MSIINDSATSETRLGRNPSWSERGNASESIRTILDETRAKIMPVWPLEDYVAVNPLGGFTQSDFLSARKELRLHSNLETLMPLAYCRTRFEQGAFGRREIDLAIDSLVEDGIQGAERLDAQLVLQLLKRAPGLQEEPASVFPGSVIDQLDRRAGSAWQEVIKADLCKHYSTHFDKGQMSWASPWRDRPLYEAWREAMAIDRSMEIRGLSGFRHVISNLPISAEAAIVDILTQMRVPDELWAHLLLSEAMSQLGWSAWASYLDQVNPEGPSNLVDMLAIRLAYAWTVSKHEAVEINWAEVGHALVAKSREMQGDQILVRYALLRASEIAYEEQLIEAIHDRPQDDEQSSPQSCRAQMVFCIDVRSERLRRHIEGQSKQIDTFGFAGFFGAPMEWLSHGQQQPVAQVPAIASPQFTVCEHHHDSNHGKVESLTTFFRKIWKGFQNSTLGGFAAVESTGLWHSLHLLVKSSAGMFGYRKIDKAKANAEHSLVADVGELEKIDLAESILRGIGLTVDFSPLVVLCGHGSTSHNNPQKAGLDCGACGGHSGEPNARFVSQLLNDTVTREGLQERGISIPKETQFVPALHDTTSDEILLLEDELQEERRLDWEWVAAITNDASRDCRNERKSELGVTANDLLVRGGNWSEVRPEWGLAGNAAFIAGPRDLTARLDLKGRAFLHSYDQERDPEFAVLEQVLTAPLVVAHMINMQYYASTVDPMHLGSGNKTVHNVVGQFGVLLGNGSDLQAGLAWESIHDGCSFRHEPLRLLAIIAAPRSAITKIIQKHQNLTELVGNSWLHLAAIEDGVVYRCRSDYSWEECLTPERVGYVSPSARSHGEESLESHSVT